MANNLVFTSRADKDLKVIKAFYDELYGTEKSLDIVKGLILHLKILVSEKDFSQIGSLDHQFELYKLVYRKVFYHYLRITYRIGKESIFIVRVFDARQNPKKNL
jgi:plasmid stabilization system protein ParE